MQQAGDSIWYTSHSDSRCIVQQDWYSAGGADCDDVGVYCYNEDVDCYNGGVDCDDGMFIVIRVVLL